METDQIVVRGARVHNLKDIDIELPKNKLICFTGVSGSGKSSMAFDTLYAEGQRRYVTSLSAYARQFLGQIEKPDIDSISGLAPTISIAQKTAGSNPRSTVGTITEIYDYLRVLFARVGTPHCISCGEPIGAQSRDQMSKRILSLPNGATVQLLAPIVQERKGEYHELFEELQKSGYIRARIDGNFFKLDEAPPLDRYSRHSIEVVVDRITLKKSNENRLTEAIETALRLGEGTFILSRNNEHDQLYSESFDCPTCDISYKEPTPQMFSFNNPQGMCLECKGLGTQVLMSEQLLVPDPTLSIRGGAISPLGNIRNNRWRLHMYEGAAKYLGFDLDVPWKELNQDQKKFFLHGTGEKKITFTYTNRRGYTWSHEDIYEGVINFLEERFQNGNDRVKRELEPYMVAQVCSGCRGGRLRPESLAVRIEDLALSQITCLSIDETRNFFLNLKFDPIKTIIAEEALKEIRGRLHLMCDMGLGYLSLDRGAHTLSGGEAQRIRLASQIGSGLVGVIYILDEPSIGLHHRDNRLLLKTLKRLRDIGNTVIVVEHDEETMRESDLVVDFGPSAGEHGGQLVICGTPHQVSQSATSITGQYLSGKKRIAVPKKRRAGNGNFIEILGARHHNLKGIDVRIPLGCLTSVCGTSGSGKSSLINGILFPALDRILHKAQCEVGAYDELRGVEYLDKVIRIDQKPIGRTPRSNPATYTDVFTPIRQLFAQLPEAQLRGYKQGRFSFNVDGGRCEACNGNGSNLIEMEFLADVWVECQSCRGNRFNRETLSIKFKDKSISDILRMEVKEALEFFDNIPKIQKILATLNDVGLGYIKLGQSATTLSGGEAQRVKLAKELCRPNTGRTLYLLDEPTTGLHFDDVDKLLNILHTFADQGNTVVVIEHNMEVIKTADYILDLGPDGGVNGGELIGAGSPQEIASHKNSPTGQYLKEILREIDEVTDSKKYISKKARKIENIEVKGASQHNLKKIDVKIPREKLTVISGVSGSGKSSLAFDTIYAEGQRRYVESLSAYARQFLEQMQKTKVEHISGLSPAIAIEQKPTSKNPRSTVGTVTEIYDYMRALFATIGIQYCPKCNVPVGTQTAEQIVDRIIVAGQRRVILLAPVEPRNNEGYETMLERARSEGFLRVRIDDTIQRLDGEIKLERSIRHKIELVVDRLVPRSTEISRLNESVERAIELSQGEVIVLDIETQTETCFSRQNSCPECGNAFEQLHSQSFSFNHQHGMCPVCEGLGEGEGLDRDLVISNPHLTVRNGAIDFWGVLTNNDFIKVLELTGRKLGFDIDTPLSEMSEEDRRALLYGSLDKKIQWQDGHSLQYKGILPIIDEWAKHSTQFKSRLKTVPCSACEGSRLKIESRTVYLRDHNINKLVRYPISKSLAFFERLQLDLKENEIAGELLVEIRSRLKFLSNVGLDYISLDRKSSTLSGGESQRIRLASQIGSGLTGVLYLLDEPTIGLHPRDTSRLLDALTALRDLGNTLIMVEHDRETIEKSDFVLDIGPEAGKNGGLLTAKGSLASIRRSRKSKTGAYFRDELNVPKPEKRRSGNGNRLIACGVRHNNLRNLNIQIPLGVMVGITGVSGSGKSSFVGDVIFNGVANTIQNTTYKVGEFDEIIGTENLDKVINIDQSPIGHSPRSTPATIMGVFDLIRQLYTELPESKIRGYAPGRFSFNKPGGRCERCEGLGQRCIEMHFLPDVWVECESCSGKRYIEDVLQVRFKEHSISDTLNLTVQDALTIFTDVPRIQHKLQVMDDVGLGYMGLGQSSTTLSGGEAQRLKLATELARPNTGKTLFILDEPTTGLHAADVRKLLVVLDRLVDSGNSMLIVEHNLDVIKHVDHIVDLGPEGGAGGGTLVAEGTPEEVAKIEKSHTGVALKPFLI